MKVPSENPANYKTPMKKEKKKSLESFRYSRSRWDLIVDLVGRRHFWLLLTFISGHITQAKKSSAQISAPPQNTPYPSF